MALFENFQREYDEVLEGQTPKTNDGGLTHFGEVVGSDISVARAVVRSGDGEGVALPSETTVDADIVGITERYFIDKNAYSEGDAVNVRYLGYIAVKVHGGCERGGKAYVHIKGDKIGQFSGVAVSDGTNDTIELSGAEFTGKVADGQITNLHIQTRRGV